jgi:hypothetical protein
LGSVWNAVNKRKGASLVRMFLKKVPDSLKVESLHCNWPKSQYELYKSQMVVPHS